MTTIAYRNGELAGDGRVTDGEVVISDKDRKVWKFRDGRLFAYCGATADGEKLLHAVRGHNETPVLNPEEATAILVMPDGKVFRYEGSVWVPDHEPFTAMGSGQMFAWGALEAGASAEDAVRVACRRHTASGGLVRTVRLSK